MAQVLLIESDPLLAGNLERALKKAGHKVERQPEPAAAISSADKKSPDIIIMDLLFAGRTGVEFLYEFRSYPEWIDVPVIIYSSVPEIETGLYLDEFVRLGVKHYFYKASTSLATLTEAVNYLANHESRKTPPTSYAL